MVDRASNSIMFGRMVETTAAELSHIMEVSVREHARDMVKKALGRPVHVSDPMFWPAGMLMLGLAEARKVAKRSGDVECDLVKLVDEAFSGHIELWKRQYGSKVSFVDDALAGAALLEMYDQTADEKYKEAVQKIYEFVSNAPRDDEGSVIYNASKGNRNIFADGVGQTSMFLSLYGRMFNVPEALELARTQLLNFKQYGMDERSGLCYHGYELKDGVVEKKGLLGWGRAMGWLMMGLSVHAAGGKDSELADWFREMAANTASFCRQDGGYSWQIQAMEGHFDSSATGMLIYSLLVGNEAFDSQQDEQDTIANLVNAGLGMLASQTDERGRVGSALSSCEDFGVHYQNYGHYPWGQGAALAAASLALQRQ